MKALLLLVIVYIPCLSYGQSDSIPPYALLLSKYIQYPSEQYKEKEAGMFFMEECKKMGLHTEVLTSEDTAFNFIASLYPLSLNKPNIIFLNHIDVVPPGDTLQWTYYPYSGEIKDNQICGRGSIDNKGMAIAQLFSVAQIVKMANENELPYNFSILSVSGEETDGHTGAYLISEQFLSRLNAYLILGEGGSGVKGIVKSDPEKMVFGVSTVEKSKMIVCLNMEISSSGHGSIPPNEYAMKELTFALEKVLKKKPKIIYNRTSVRALKNLGRHEKGFQGFAQRHFTFIVFKPFAKRAIKKDPVLLSFFANTISYTKLVVPEGSNNMISHNASAIFDCRLLPNEKPDKFIKRLHKWVKDDRIKITIVSRVLSAPKTNQPVVFSKLKTAIQNRYADAVVLDMIFPATTDNNYFRAKGIPVIGVFPACFTEEELKSIHNTNEKIHMERIEAAIEIYTEFLKSFANEKNHLSLTGNK